MFLICRALFQPGPRHAASCTEAAQPYDPLPPPQTASHLSLSYSHLLPASSESDTAVSAALGRMDGWMKGWTDGWRDGRTDEELNCWTHQMNWCGVSLPVSAQTVEELPGLMLTARPLSKPICLSAALHATKPQKPETASAGGLPKIYLDT